MTRRTRREHYGENLFRDVAMDERDRDDDDDSDEERDGELAKLIADAVTDALRSYRARDKRGKDASEELSGIEREFATREGEGRNRSNANISTRSGPKDGDRSRARGRDAETDHRRDFEPTTADSRHGYSRSIDIDAIWSPAGTA